MQTKLDESNQSWIDKAYEGFFKADAFTQLDFTVSMVGLFITIVTALAALKIANSALIKVFKIESATFISRSADVIDKIRHAIRENSWELLPDLYAQLRSNLGIVRHSLHNLNKATETELQKLISTIGAIENAQNANHKKRPSNRELNSIFKTLTGTSNILIELEISLKRRAK